VSAFVLATRHAIYGIVVVGLMAGFAMVLIERLLPPAGRWLPIRLLSAFFHLNLFSAQALFAFARDRELHLW
jgi:hypothetical protein